MDRSDCPHAGIFAVRLHYAQLWIFISGILPGTADSPQRYAFQGSAGAEVTLASPGVGMSADAARTSAYATKPRVRTPQKLGSGGELAIGLAVGLFETVATLDEDLDFSW